MRQGRELPGLSEQTEMSYAYYNENPLGKSTGDCVIRAISKALGKTWDEVYVGLCLEGFLNGVYTVSDFAKENPRGTFIVSMPGKHVLCVKDGTLYDSWDSSGETPSYFWKKEK